MVARLELLQRLNKEFHPRKPEKPFCPHLCFEAENMDDVVKALEENGIPILDGPHEIPGSESWIYFTDPDQNVLEYIVWFNKDKGGSESR